MMSYVKQLSALMLLLLLFFNIPAQQLRTDVLAFTHVTVIDMTGAPPKRNMTVVITRDRITTIRRTGKVPVPHGAQIINATGKFLIPGLWDMHAHFTETERSFPMFIANGELVVRNMGGNPEDLFRWRQEVAE
jgi:cytosine/adenosine deaminase-related metal-dependent hydrolase